MSLSYFKRHTVIHICIASNHRRLTAPGVARRRVVNYAGNFQRTGGFSLRRKQEFNEGERKAITSGVSPGSVSGTICLSQLKKHEVIAFDSSAAGCESEI